jgi:hypothetical protein
VQGADHLPIALRLAIGQGASSFTLDVKLADWNELVAGAAPTA